MVENQPNIKNVSVASPTGFDDNWTIENYFRFLPGICSLRFRGEEVETVVATGFKFSCYLITL